jgi:ABC-type sugar transport system substrate-binding protein
MNKKFLFVVFALVLILGMVSTAFAGGKSDNKSQGVVVGYIAKNSVDAFHYPINTTATRLLNDLKANGTIQNWHFFDGLTDPVTQVQLLNDAINMGCNFIIMLPAEAAGCAPMLTTCKEKNIPVIVVNSKTSNTDQLATAYVGSDDVQAGEIMARFVQEQIPAGGGYGHIQGVIGNSAQIQRGQGLHNVLDKDPKWTLLDGAEQSAEWQAEKAVRFAEDWLTKYGTSLNAIICDNDDMSSAVQAAMNAANRRDIVAIGVDGNAGPLNMVKNGDLRATVFQDGVGQITKAIELMVKVIGGETVPKETMVDFILITKDNVNNYLN